MFIFKHGFLLLFLSFQLLKLFLGLYLLTYVPVFIQGSHNELNSFIVVVNSYINKN